MGFRQRLFAGSCYDRSRSNFFSRADVFFQQQWRNGKTSAHVGESVPDSVRGEILGNMQINPKQVANRIVVLYPIESLNRLAPDINNLAAVAMVEFLVEPLDESDLLITGRTVFGIDRRHPSDSKLPKYFFPD